MNHKAECQCGALFITSTEGPDFVIACNCRACQKRTGSVFGVGAYFRKDFVTINGDAKDLQRATESGRTLTNHFCPECGSNLFWSLEMRPDHFGVSGGCMVSRLPEPNRAIWTSEKHDWVSFPDEWPNFEYGTPAPK